MSDNGKAPDPVEAAIAATEQGPTFAMAQAQVTISSSGRPFAMQFPADMTDAEMAEVCGWMLTNVLQGLRQQRAKTPAGRIIVPGRLA